MALSRFQVIRVSERAAERVREIVANAAAPAEGIRVGIKKGGCAGMEYTVDLAREATPGDDVVDVGGAKVFVNPQATLFLLGTEMDFEATKLRTGFVFKNPNQTSACGCGESVEIKPAAAERLAEARG
jgi:iron-sulfur cluster assembly protein